MPRADTLLNEIAWIPKPLRTPLEWAVVKAIVSNPYLQRNIEDKLISLSRIQTTQSRLDKDKVASMVANKEYHGGLAFQSDDGIFLIDGHHRHFAAQELGKDARRIKIFKLPAEPMSLKDFSKQLGVRVPTLLKNFDSHDLLHLEDKDHFES